MKITHLKEAAGLLSRHFFSTPPIRSLPYKLALKVKDEKKRLSEASETARIQQFKYHSRS